MDSAETTGDGSPAVDRASPGEVSPHPASETAAKSMLITLSRDGPRQARLGLTSQGENGIPCEGYTNPTVLLFPRIDPSSDARIIILCSRGLDPPAWSRSARCHGRTDLPESPHSHDAGDTHPVGMLDNRTDRLHCASPHSLGCTRVWRWSLPGGSAVARRVSGERFLRRMSTVSRCTAPGTRHEDPASARNRLLPVSS